jgi:hypothetical protein
MNGFESRRNQKRALTAQPFLRDYRAKQVSRVDLLTMFHVTAM